MHSEKKIRDSLKKLQRFAGLPVSGILDEPTQKLIETPRCGLPDITKEDEKRERRYVLQGSKWRKNVKHCLISLSFEVLEKIIKCAKSMFKKREVS